MDVIPSGARLSGKQVVLMLRFVLLQFTSTLILACFAAIPVIDWIPADVQTTITH